jgi:hypothetical protein
MRSQLILYELWAHTPQTHTLVSEIAYLIRIRSYTRKPPMYEPYSCFYVDLAVFLCRFKWNWRRQSRKRYIHYYNNWVYVKSSQSSPPLQLVLYLRNLLEVKFWSHWTRLQAVYFRASIGKLPWNDILSFIVCLWCPRVMFEISVSCSMITWRWCHLQCDIWSNKSGILLGVMFYLADNNWKIKCVSLCFLSLLQEISQLCRDFGFGIRVVISIWSV